MAQTTLPELVFVRFLFRDMRMASLWFVVRLYVGYEWLIAGWGKVTDPAWIGFDAGGPLMGFAKGAIAKTLGAHPDVSGWYAAFLQHVVLAHPILWSNFVAYGELLVGIGLLVGLATGIAAFFGFFMNLNYLLAGTVSVNPQLLVLSVLLMLAWRIAGYWGIDYLALPVVEKYLKTRLLEAPRSA